MHQRRSSGQRAGLSHRHVLLAARELLEQEGLEAVSMRALARRLGVSPNALYSHVATKTALIDDVLDDVLADVEAPEAGQGDWQAGLRSMMTSTHAVLLAHADLVTLYVARQGARGPNAQRLGKLMLELLARGGVTGTHAREAQRVLIVHAIGSAAFTSRAPLEPREDEAVGPPRAELVRAFERGLSWLLTGIAATGRR